MYILFILPRDTPSPIYLNSQSITVVNKYIYIYIYIVLYI